MDMEMENPRAAVASLSGKGLSREDDPVAEFRSFDWDGENHGNPRVVDGLPDIGSDEIHLWSMAGSWSQHSSSHNKRGALNPSVPSDGLPNRYFILPRLVTTAGTTYFLDNGSFSIKVHGSQVVPPTLPPPGLTAWTIPPGALAIPAVGPAFPADYATKYISFANSGSPTPWTQALGFGNRVTYHLPGHGSHNLSLDFLQAGPVVDDEGTVHSYFNTQGVIVETAGAVLRGNMQAEYR
jgi:hypothetical protein